MSTSQAALLKRINDCLEIVVKCETRMMEATQYLATATPEDFKTVLNRQLAIIRYYAKKARVYNEIKNQLWDKYKDEHAH